MISNRKLESNKRNASRSTGPRTPGGKLRSRNNARRHGLATHVEDDVEAAAGIELLAAILSEGTDDFGQIEHSRFVAECHFDLRQIRAARHDVFKTMHDLGNASSNDFESALRAIDRIGRYERRARSKSKTYNCTI
jgi:DNA repair protein RadC